MLENTIAEIRDLLIDKYGQTESELTAMLKIRESKFGNSKKTKRDFYWERLNALLNHISSTEIDSEAKNSELRQVYFLMFSFLKDEGRNADHITKALNDLYIQQIAMLDFECTIRIIPTKDCEYSQQFMNVEMSLDVAINNFPLDYSKCDREGGCVCNIGSNAIRDANDCLIMKESPIQEELPERNAEQQSVESKEGGFLSFFARLFTDKSK